jgi:hypothetical protein
MMKDQATAKATPIGMETQNGMSHRINITAVVKAPIPNY